jgi:hypothetical protein
MATSSLLRKWVPSVMRNVPVSPINWIVDRVGQVVQERLTSGNSRKDLLQLMLDAAKEEDIQVGFCERILNSLSTICLGS